MSEKLILITNDDGVNTDGIVTLKKTLEPLGRIVVFAPSHECSATSHSLTLSNPVRIKQIEEDVYSVTGFPADCVYAGIHGLLPKKPDIVISGVNKGANMGVDVYYSGTVAGIRQAVIDGVTGMSVSLVVGRKDRDYFWDDVSQFTKHVVLKMLKADYKNRGFININYPNVPKDKIRGVKITKMGDRKYIEEVLWRKDPRGGEYYWLWGDYASFNHIDGSDCVAIDGNYISITPMLLDITDYSMIEEVESWGL